MTTTNALTFLLRDAGLKKPSEVNLMPIEKDRAELMEFSRVLDRLGTGVTSERVETKVDYSQTKTFKSSSTDEDIAVRTEEFDSKISEKIKSKEPQKVDEKIVEEAVEQFGQEVISLLCTTLNITPEELMTGMEELELNVGDLLEPSNLANLFVHFGNDVSVTDILMSEDFQMVKNQIAELEVTLSTELSATDEELKELLETFDKTDGLKHTPKPVEEADVIVENVKPNEEVLTQQVNPETEATESGIVTEVTEKSEDGILQPQQMDTNSNANEEKEGEFQNTLKEVKVEFEPNNRDEAVREDMNGQTVRQTVVTNPDGTVVQETVKVVDLQNLVSEVTEYVRLTTGNEFSKIEMQINPANLGKMIVEVSTANGEVTTKIIAQTEAGKEAIESNLNQMRSNLEQQGIKVAAVEVTVESHAFEQNLQGEGSDEQERLMKEQQENNRKHQMNLNLNELTLDDLSGLMSEEEMLTVRMMRENGNKIDLTV